MIFNAFLFSLKGYSETLSCRLECCNFSKETPEQGGKTENLRTIASVNDPEESA